MQALDVLWVWQPCLPKFNAPALRCTALAYSSPFCVMATRALQPLLSDLRQPLGVLAVSRLEKIFCISGDRDDEGSPAMMSRPATRATLALRPGPPLTR